MRATFNGTILAESDATVIVEGNHYFPAESVRWDLLTQTESRTRCPWKGEAVYFSVNDGTRRGTDIAFSYQDPKPAAQQIAGRLAFWRGVSVTE